jgi:hypothetical protein
MRRLGIGLRAVAERFDGAGQFAGLVGMKRLEAKKSRRQKVA